MDFTNTIVVMTSNVGSPLIQEISAEGGTDEQMRTAVTEAMQARFLPEFLNRIDETIIFHPLNRAQIRSIVDFQIEALAKLLAGQQLGLEVTDSARQEIANRGYDPTYGARPLKRIIQQQLQNPLATELLKGSFPEESTVEVDFDGDQFSFSSGRQTEKKSSLLPAL